MKIYATLPVCNEADIEKTLQDIINQTVKPDIFFICVNQPESFWENDDKFNICCQNVKTIDYLNDFQKNTDIVLYVIDKASKGNGCDKKKFGVGMARKLMMDMASQLAESDDIIVCLDADTEYPSNYFERLIELYSQNPDILANANQYYHKLVKKPDLDYAILRYEIYMRFYYLNLKRIKSTYQFTAIGSAMSCRASAYKLINGISPKPSGEDFYFLQQMAKVGKVANDNVVTVYPSSRISDRVIFGTGKAVKDIMDKRLDISYTIYAPYIWDIIAEMYVFFNFLADLVFDIEKNNTLDFAKEIKNYNTKCKIPREDIFKNQLLFGYERFFNEAYLIDEIEEAYLKYEGDDSVEGSKKAKKFAREMATRFKKIVNSIFIGNQNTDLIDCSPAESRIIHLKRETEHELSTVNLFEKFLKNSKTRGQFLKFCDEKFDGLNIMQSLKELNVVMVNREYFDEDVKKKAIETQANIIENAKIFGITLSDNFSSEELIDMAALRDDLYRLT